MNKLFENWRVFLSDVDCEQDGICIVAATKIAEDLLSRGIRNFKIIEGYVWTTGSDDQYPTEHTWIQMDDGKIVDPSSAQFDKYGGVEERITGVALDADGEEYGKAKVYSPEEYLETPMINENVFADYEADKGEWVDIPVGDIQHDPDNVDLTDELYALIDIAYAPIGGHFDFDSPSDLPSDHNNWLAMDWDEDPQPDVLRVGKSKTGGTKMTAAGHDGQKRSKGHYIRKTIDMLGMRGFYAEMSKRIADIMIGSGVPYVDNEETVRKVLGASKPIQWLGAHPEGKHPEYQGWYRRAVGGHEGELKIMLGSPTVSGAVEEQNEPFQKKVKAKHTRMKKKLVGPAGGARSKSAPPGAGGS